ncbi:Sulfite reductase [NADPH] flavoprotein alpha-component [Buchnera aphidicola (Protaphis terricola)]|uniref:assimilatory sulfite reductase (NADPH) flavoprotein subunit n=1 Tax=Buchnera aphidicola TaxID=9 RepID=UPI003464A85F
MKNKNFFNSIFPLDSNQIELLKDFEKNCSNVQLAWISGYFWNLANQNSFNDKNNINVLDLEKKNINDHIITIVSASQTGNARLLSKRLNAYLNKNNKKTYLIKASDYNFKNIKNEKFLILIISTQGEGEPPEEALSLYKFIMSKRAPKLNHLKYSIFSLGDSSYNLFCQAGKDFDKRLNELGASKLIDRLDNDIEYEDNYIKWSKELLLVLNKVNILSSSSTISLEKNSNTIKNYTKYSPAVANIINNQKITGRNSTKDIRHIEIDISNLNIKYKPGDALGVWYKNDINLVKKILKTLSIKKSSLIKFKNKKINIFEALKNHFELTKNTKNIVKKYADITENKFLKNIVSNDQYLEKYVENTPLINMIKDHPYHISCQDFINILRPLTPRLYSISSSQAENIDEIHITVSVVKKNISGEIHLGGASGYLSVLLKIDDPLEIFIEENNNFRLPDDQTKPIIMIGSGTGIAPYRAFMQQRDNDKSTGKNWIFFGNPNFTEDFLYQIEWQRYLKKGLLTNITLAWSRDQEKKIYIQDKMKECGKEIWNWIEDQSYIYVCGSASNMAKDVHQALLDIISYYGNMNIESANKFLDNLRLTRRYQRDIY